MTHARVLPTVAMATKLASIRGAYIHVYNIIHIIWVLLSIVYRHLMKCMHGRMNPN